MIGRPRLTWFLAAVTLAALLLFIITYPRLHPKPVKVSDAEAIAQCAGFDPNAPRPVIKTQAEFKAELATLEYMRDMCNQALHAMEKKAAVSQ